MSAIQFVTVPWVVDSLKAFLGTYVQTKIPNCGPQQNITVELCANPEELPMSPPVQGMYVSFGAKVWAPPDWHVSEVVVDLAHVDRSLFQAVRLTKSAVSDSWLAAQFLDFWQIVSDRYAINRFNCSIILVYITLKHSKLVHGFEENQSALCKMFQESLWTDFQVRGANGEVFEVHKSVLAARSPVFAAMLDCSMKERHCNYVEIVDFDPAVVRSMLEYLYTGGCNADNESIWDLILISDKYRLVQLKSYCEQMLMKQVQQKNLGRILILAHRITSPVLKAKAVNEIVGIGPTFLESDEWKLLESEDTKLANDVLKEVWKSVHK